MILVELLHSYIRQAKLACQSCEFRRLAHCGEAAHTAHGTHQNGRDLKHKQLRIKQLLAPDGHALVKLYMDALAERAHQWRPAGW